MRKSFMRNNLLESSLIRSSLIRKSLLMLIFVAFSGLLAGCNSDENIPDAKPANTNQALGDKDTLDKEDNKQPPVEDETVDYSKFQGVWELKTVVDEELYSLTAMMEYLGSTGIHISEINGNKVQGNIYSIQGPPSYRQATVSFSGVIEDGKLTTTYEDTGWEYTGTMELEFREEGILAKITRDESEFPAMWGIPEGEFTYIRAIETEKVQVTTEEKESLEEFLATTSKDLLQPFAEGALTDENMINFVSHSLALGKIDLSKYGDKVIHGPDIVFEESVLDDITKRYFNSTVQKHQAYALGTYEKGKYTVPALGGVTEYPELQLLMQDQENPEIYYGIVDYVFEHPSEGKSLEYQYLIKLHKNGDYTIKAITEIEYPIDFSLFIS